MWTDGMYLQGPHIFLIRSTTPAPSANKTEIYSRFEQFSGTFVVMNSKLPHEIRASGPSLSGMGMADNVYQSLLQNRIIFLGSDVRDENANAICAQMLLLNAEDPKSDIWLYINSPGGVVDSGMAIYDTMQWISNDVATVAMGLAASMGQFLLSAGTKGKRFALPHSRIMMHQPLGGIGGTASDIAIQAEQSRQIKHQMAKLISEQTGQPLEKIQEDSDRDRWFTAEQAKEYGLIDHVYTKASQIPVSDDSPNR